MNKEITRGGEMATKIGMVKRAKGLNASQLRASRFYTRRL